MNKRFSKNISKIFQCVLICSMSSVLCADENINSKVLRVFAAVEGSPQKPFADWKAGEEEPAGFDSDVMRLVAKEMGYKLKFIKPDLSQPWTDLRRELLEKDIVGVVAYAYTITPERAKYLEFSQPYYTSRMMALIRKESPIKSLEQLKQARVLSFKHTTAYPWAKKHIEGGIFTSFPVGFQGDVEEMLLNKHVDAYLGDEANMRAMAQKEPRLRVLEKALQVEPLGLAMKKGDFVLKKKINQALAEIESNGSMEKLRQKYFPIK